MCTRMGCGAGTCWDNNGTSYQANQTRQAKDGECCTCQENGKWGCTKLPCPVSHHPSYHFWHTHTHHQQADATVAACPCPCDVDIVCHRLMYASLFV